MKMKMKQFFSAIVLVCLAISVSAVEPANTLSAVLKGEHRSAENKARDQYRHPEQTLAFFDVKEDMTVVEIWPGAGWYTEILAPYLKDRGMLYAAHFSPNSSVPYFRNNLQQFNEKLSQNPQLYGKLKVTVLQPPEEVQIAPAESVDRVLTFRNVHNWLKAAQADAVFGAMFKALKPGGILGVVEHRAGTNTSELQYDESGYVSEATVIDLATKAGFILLAKSELNANSKDTKNYPAGVWSLPPTHGCLSCHW
jgi:predicted methyltransferase